MSELSTEYLLTYLSHFASLSLYEIVYRGPTDMWAKGLLFNTLKILKHYALPTSSHHYNSSHTVRQVELFINSHPLIKSYQARIRECGNYLPRSYRDIHAYILSGVLPSRYLIYVIDDEDISMDRFVDSIVTVFYLAVLSNRAFYIISMHSGVLNKYFFSPFIHLNGFDDIMELEVKEFMTAHVYQSKHDNVTNIACRNDSKYCIFGWQYSYQSRCIHSNIDSHVNTQEDHSSSPQRLFDNTSVYITSYSMIYRDYKFLQAFVNNSTSSTNHRDVFRGIHRRLVFSCAFYFLFRPNIKLLRRTQALSHRFTEHDKDSTIISSVDHQLQNQTSAAVASIKIGIEMYLDVDANLTTIGNISLPFIQCAERLENAIASSMKARVVWYVASNSLTLKNHLKSLYPSKVVTNDESYSERPADRYADTYNNDTSPSFEDFTIDDVAHDYYEMIDVLMLSLCDYFIMSNTSQVGRLAVLLSRHGEANEYVLSSTSTPN